MTNIRDIRHTFINAFDPSKLNRRAIRDAARFVRQQAGDRGEPISFAKALKTLRYHVMQARMANPIETRTVQQQIAGLRNEIDMLVYKPIGHNIRRERDVLEQQIAALEAAA